MKLCFPLVLLAIVVGFGSRIGMAAGNNSNLPSSDVVIITNWGSDTISLLNVKTAEHLGQIDVGPKPYDVKVESSARFAYVASSGSNFISKVDLIAKLEQRDQRIVVGDSPRDLALTRDGRRAVVANSGSDDVSVVDLAAGKEAYRISNVGSAPYGVALTADDKTAVVTLYAGNKVAVLDIGAEAGRVIRTIDVAGGPYTASTSPNGRFAFVTCFNDGVVSVVDIQKGVALPPVKVGKSPWGLGMSQDGTFAVVANFNSQDVSIIDIDQKSDSSTSAQAKPARERKRMSVSLRGSGDAALSPHVLSKAKNAVIGSDASFAVVTDLATNEVILIDIPAGKVRSRTKVGQAPYGVDFIPRRP